MAGEQGSGDTEQGRAVETAAPTSPPTPTAGTSVPAVDVAAVLRSLGSAWAAYLERRAATAGAGRGSLLASDGDRDVAVQQLSAAFAQGRLSAPELDERTGRALGARTYGDLDGVLHDLGGLQRPVRNHPVRKAVFWLVALLTSPFVLLGALLAAFGTDTGDHVGGLVFLVVLLPGLFALRRWTWPRA